MGLSIRTRMRLLIGSACRPRLSDHHGDIAAMAIIEADLKLRELCERASKEHDHEKLIDLVKQINDLLDQKHRESGTEDDDERQAAPALATLFGGRRDRWLREWREYQPLFLSLASLAPVHSRVCVFSCPFSFFGFEWLAGGGAT